VIGYANEGVNFLFGGIFQAENVGSIFAFQVLPIIIFFSSLISVLYYLGIMQWIIKILGGGLAKLLGTSNAESLSAAANIFVGQTEAPLVIKPYIAKLTQSALFGVMVGGLASVAGSVLVGYSLLGVPLEYLLAASFMAAPAGLVLAKIMLPETEKPQTTESLDMERDEESANVIQAAASGASVG
uniref:nucleoside recognition domain-containing protein n=1 Tax=Enterococcus faecium TaxID=1352 RepID=UPI0030C7FEB4